MDHAVSLVQAYLQLNGYFTSAEYPIVAGTPRNGFRTITDIDILAFRFPTEGALTRGKQVPKGLNVRDLDAGLGVPAETIDLIIGEVKEGRVGINSGVRDPDVLRAVIGRFGDMADTDDVIASLIKRGMAEIPPAYTARVIAFGSFPPGAPVPPCRIISLGHVYDFLQNYVRKNWDMLRHMQFKDPAFGFLMTLEKARRGEAGRRGADGVELVGPEGEQRVARPRPEAVVIPPEERPMAQQRPLSARPIVDPKKKD